MSKLRLFVAGSSDTRLRIREIIDFFARLGHEITYDWTRAPDWDLGRDLTVEEALEVSRLNRQGVRDCDVFVWVVDGDHPSKGAHYEAGLAEGFGKPMFTIAAWKKPATNVIHALEGPRGSTNDFLEWLEALPTAVPS